MQFSFNGMLVGAVVLLGVATVLILIGADVIKSEKASIRLNMPFGKEFFAGDNGAISLYVAGGVAAAAGVFAGYKSYQEMQKPKKE
jgi:hypothetical protein